MNIPDFPLPSNPKTVISFRTPTVADAMDCSEINPDFEERATTKYLNSMQVGEVRDSALWTAQDRRAALWWIFISSNPDPSATFSYECTHCGKVHHQDLDLMSLDAMATHLKREPVIRTTVNTNGKPVEWQIVPLDGRSVEFFERYRANNPLPSDKDSKEYRAEKVRRRLLNEALRTRLADDPEDFSEAVERRYQMILSMDCATEYQALSARIKQSEDVLKHGLACAIEDGEIFLLCPPHYCTTKKQEVSEAGKGAIPYTNLLIGFRPIYFFPQL